MSKQQRTANNKNKFYLFPGLFPRRNPTEENQRGCPCARFVWPPPAATMNKLTHNQQLLAVAAAAAVAGWVASTVLRARGSAKGAPADTSTAAPASARHIFGTSAAPRDEQSGGDGGDDGGGDDGVEECKDAPGRRVAGFTTAALSTPGAGYSPSNPWWMVRARAVRGCVCVHTSDVFRAPAGSHTVISCATAAAPRDGAFVVQHMRGVLQRRKLLTVLVRACGSACVCLSLCL